MGCLSQNVCTAASAAVAGEGGGARKTEDENQEEGGDQGPPLALGNIDPTYVKKNQNTETARVYAPQTPHPRSKVDTAPFPPSDTPHMLVYPLIYHSHAAGM